MTEDPHILKKIASCRCEVELDGLVDGLRMQRIEPDGKVVSAIAVRRAEIQRGARK